MAYDALLQVDVLIRPGFEIMNNRLLEPEDLADLLKKGSAAIFPTDTVPALAAAPTFSSQLWKQIRGLYR